MRKYFVQNKNEKQYNEVYGMQMKQWLQGNLGVSLLQVQRSKLKMSKFRVRKDLLIKKLPIQMRKYFVQNKNEKQCTKFYVMQIKQWLQEIL